MSSEYLAQIIHDERATQLRAEAAADRLARTALRATKRAADGQRDATRRSTGLLRGSVRRQRGRHAV
ncbi:hypothetical protein [Jiangella asiatica]|uniref:Uncharacterized protein n=1 Tax=Jiangella asiatica TaxID=2530372 RepID=A0A4R5D7S9_9ACTN|nr:hypothetical protein [Jiangella asiatica]TDE08737.1 hypothetical protein E1269_16315 [Jiangella asiatica]